LRRHVHPLSPCVRRGLVLLAVFKIYYVLVIELPSHGGKSMFISVFSFCLLFLHHGCQVTPTIVSVSPSVFFFFPSLIHIAFLFRQTVPQWLIVAICNHQITLEVICPCTVFFLIIIIFINCNWVVTQWQWLFHMYTKHEIG